MNNYPLRITEYDVHVCVCVVCVKSLLSKYVHINNRQVLTVSVSKRAVRLGTLSIHYNYFVK